MVLIETQKVELILDVKADIEEWGFKFHMNDVCAKLSVWKTLNIWIDW